MSNGCLMPRALFGNSGSQTRLWVLIGRYPYEGSMLFLTGFDAIFGCKCNKYNISEDVADIVFKNHKFHQATLASNQNQANFMCRFLIVQIICNGIPSSTNTG